MPKCQRRGRGGGCCDPVSECWFCPQIPTLLNVTAPGGDCCGYWTGSYVLDDSCDQLVGPPPGVRLDCTGDYLNVGCGPYKNIEEVATGGYPFGLVCDYFYVCEPSGGLDRTTDFFLVHGVSFRVRFDEVAGLPRVRVTAAIQYGQITNGRNACAAGIFNAQNRILLEDEYESIITDCDDIDGLGIEYVGRTRYVFGNEWFESVNTDPDNITFGDELSWQGEQSQTVAACGVSAISIEV